MSQIDNLILSISLTNSSLKPFICSIVCIRKYLLQLQVQGVAQVAVFRKPKPPRNKNKKKHTPSKNEKQDAEFFLLRNYLNAAAPQNQKTIHNNSKQQN